MHDLETGRARSRPRMNSKRTVGAGLVPARAQVVQAARTGRPSTVPQFNTGRDKPVPYRPVPKSCKPHARDQPPAPCANSKRDVPTRCRIIRRHLARDGRRTCDLSSSCSPWSPAWPAPKTGIPRNTARTTRSAPSTSSPRRRSSRRRGSCGRAVRIRSAWSPGGTRRPTHPGTTPSPSSNRGRTPVPRWGPTAPPATTTCSIRGWGSAARSTALGTSAPITSTTTGTTRRTSSPRGA